MSWDWLPIVCAIAIGLLGIAQTIYSCFSFRRWWRASTWPRVNGLITESWVSVDHSGDDYHEKHVMSYLYKVDGKEYVGHRIRAGGDLALTIGGMHGGSAWSTAQQTQQQLRPGQNVKVIYNPANPAESCLLAGGWVSPVLEMLLGLGLTALGAYLMTSPDWLWELLKD